MKFKEMLEIGEDCGLLTARECALNVQIHAASLFPYEKITEELSEMMEEYNVFQSVYKNFINTDDCLRKMKELETIGRDGLIEEAECVEDCGEWLHMSLMGYRPETLRLLATLM